MSAISFSLPGLGWSHFFQQQLCLEEWEATSPARVFAVHRSTIEVAGENGRRTITLPGHWHLRDSQALPTVGDWLLLDASSGQPQRMLERKSLFRRKAAGGEAKVQSMAANVDTLFVVTSCNRDFNPSRLERYLALALEAKVEPVLVLTKADLADDVSDYRRQAMGLNPDMAVETVNALDPDSVASLLSWCGTGQTVALTGSSGVGKSTLINTLCGAPAQATGAIREDDAKGRHTTTSRTVHFLPEGGLLIDSPGIRELQLSACEDGVSSLFGDIEELAQSCRFNDCRHGGEDGCAVTAAVSWGDLDPRRLANYQKLMAEQERNAETIADRRRRERDFGKMVRSVMAAKHKGRNGR
ncbi:ribosome small subunit-dependent GTPase A [uncultured Desulfuromonas sp.]|uniref:ribosome small subunit-dependent GTPase A n=1 Tax=uncultured Desulfuromonas sp. TaxID=181013 RepID=UPI002634574A|nr:ribosome small subunit-dependent GTPase A [uncultured Desulfuromonas sp.]